MLSNIASGLQAKQSVLRRGVVLPEPSHELIHTRRIIGKFLVDSYLFVGIDKVNCFFRYVHPVEVLVLYHKIWF